MNRFDPCCRCCCADARPYPASLFVSLSGSAPTCSCYDGTYELVYTASVTFDLGGSPFTTDGWLWSGTLCGVSARLILYFNDCRSPAGDPGGAWVLPEWVFLMECDGVESSGATTDNCDPTIWPGTIHTIDANGTCCADTNVISFDVSY